MNARSLNHKQSNKGFTLVEVLLVLVIIGIIAGIAVPKMSGKTEQAMRTKARVEVSNLSMSVDLFEVDNGMYPSNLQGLMSKPGNAINWNGPYMKVMPKDPWGKDYVYQVTGNSYSIHSTGPNGGEKITAQK